MKNLILTLFFAIGLASFSGATVHEISFSSMNTQVSVDGGAFSVVTAHTVDVGDTIIFKNYFMIDNVYLYNGSILIGDINPGNLNYVYQPLTTDQITALDDDNAGNLLITITVNPSTVGFDEFDKTKFNIFPNPTTDFVNIQSDKEIGNLMIFDLNGKMVYTDFLNSEIFQVDVRDLTNGVYILKSDNFEFKIIKQ